jgi:hypothetical protein
METNRLPVDAVAAAIFGGLLGALFVVLDGPGANPTADIAAGSAVFGSLGFVRWIHRLGDPGDPG